MKNIELIPFKAEHLAGFHARAHESRMVGSDYFMEWAKINEEHSVGYSGFYEGRFIGCGGIRMLWPGVGEAWAIFAEDPREFAHEIYHYVSMGLEHIIAEHGLWRVQTPIAADIAVNIRFIENLGFEREGLMKKFGPDGDDFYIYAKVKVT